MFGGIYTRLCRLIEVGSWSQVSQRHLSSRNELKSFWFERSRYPAAKSTRVRNSMKSYELQKLAMGFHMVASWIHARYEDLCISYWWCVLGRPQANVWHQKVEGFAKAGAAVLSLRAWQVILGIPEDSKICMDLDGKWKSKIFTEFQGDSQRIPRRIWMCFSFLVSCVAGNLWKNTWIWPEHHSWIHSIRCLSQDWFGNWGASQFLGG